MPRVHHEISMKMSWVMRPKSDLGMTVVIFVSQSQPTAPQPALSAITPRSRREAARRRGGLVMVSLGGAGRPASPPPGPR